MTDRELDEIMTLWWPKVLRRAMRGSDRKTQGFARSISRQAKTPDWTPTFGQARWMRDLVEDLHRAPEPELDLIEREDDAA